MCWRAIKLLVKLLVKPTFIALNHAITDLDKLDAVLEEMLQHDYVV